MLVSDLLEVAEAAGDDEEEGEDDEAEEKGGAVAITDEAGAVDEGADVEVAAFGVSTGGSVAIACDRAPTERTVKRPIIMRMNGPSLSE